ncbi:MAG: alpha/beta fold hydrolase [Candidatus Sungbacteria bacterium]|uniref:Alpha/beta fold hydrolase n=1 Tax=Candidatus Sungiibacteriota bacterium TaxID=2750080 RepID=A0A933DRR5_9BACT|nr:alpha/beta fold hydrolase [Candidatus Sungbacteria bacterium]
MKSRFSTFMFITSAVIFFFLFTSLWGLYISIRPPKIISQITPRDLGMVYEEVSFKTRDGLALSGWFVPSSKQKTKTIVLLHGYPADKGDILPALSFLQKNYNLFLFDFRYLGKSEGSYSTAGAKEKEDLLSAIRYLKTRGIEEIGVWGFSMGGAVALMTAAEAPEMKAVVSEVSYARLDLMAPELYKIPGLRYVLGYLTGLWGNLFLGIDIQKVAPEEAARTFQIPALIIHSTNDDVISFSHALRLKEALAKNPRAEFWFQGNLVHGELGGEYQKRIEEFFSKNWPSPEAQTPSNHEMWSILEKVTIDTRGLSKPAGNRIRGSVRVATYDDLT